MARRKNVWIASALGVSTIIGLFWFWSPTQRTVDELVAEAQAAWRQGQLHKAEVLALGAIARDPQLYDAWLIAGHVAGQQRRPERALECYLQIPNNGSTNAISARMTSGDIYWKIQCNAEAAEREYLSARSQSGGSLGAERLSLLYGATTQFQRQEEFLIQLIQQGKFNNLQLHLLGAGNDVPINRDRIADCLASTPDDELLQLARAGLLIVDNDFDAARTRLEEFVAGHPDNLVALSKLGYILARQDHEGKLRNWAQRLPESEMWTAEIWGALGRLAELNGRREVAVRSYWQSIKLNPNQKGACYRLGRLLEGELDEPAKVFLERTRQLERFESLVESAHRTGNPETIRQLVTSAQELGLLWEAYGWSVVATQLGAPLWAIQKRGELEKVVIELPLTRCAPSLNPAFDYDFSNRPTWDFADSTNDNATEKNHEQLQSTIRFADIADRMGIHFQYHNGGTPASGLRHMYEMTGGGVAVLDYDCDGWPDIFLTQGHAWPVSKDPTHVDHLYRNLEGQSAQSSAAPAGIQEAGFGQGCAVGDVNSDGFPDLFIANIGANRLYLNAGDGTFLASDMSFDETNWSTSAAFVDLNSDGLTDLYVVNYLQGEDVFDHVCDDQDGQPRHTCPPSQFAPCHDEVLINLGDGRFQRLANETNGRGLGVVAGLLQKDNPYVFVANDGMANVLLTYDSETEAALLENALEAGVAVNFDGHAEACMGVAAGDVDRNGTIDLFVTNFAGETNTLYLQDDDGLFEDRTSAYQLSSSSIRKLGFGTQFLDANLDGWLDLIVANGHVNDFRYRGGDYQMNPQFYVNVSGTAFTEVGPEQLGAYFQTECLGRSAAVLDWNRDGRPDVVLSHLDRQVALLQNNAETAHHFVTFLLRGTSSERDAIGSTLSVKTGDFESTHQILSGSGYQASNQHHLFIGTGDVTEIERLEIRWPSGRTQSFTGIACDREYLIREGSPTIRTLGR